MQWRRGESLVCIITEGNDVEIVVFGSKSILYTCIRTRIPTSTISLFVIRNFIKQRTVSQASVSQISNEVHKTATAAVNTVTQISSALFHIGISYSETTKFIRWKFLSHNRNISSSFFLLPLNWFPHSFFFPLTRYICGFNLFSASHFPTDSLKC